MSTNPTIPISTRRPSQQRLYKDADIKTAALIEAAGELVAKAARLKKATDLVIYTFGTENATSRVSGFDHALVEYNMAWTQINQTHEAVGGLVQTVHKLKRHTEPPGINERETDGVSIYTLAQTHLDATQSESEGQPVAGLSTESATSHTLADFMTPDASTDSDDDAPSHDHNKAEEHSISTLLPSPRTYRQTETSMSLRVDADDTLSLSPTLDSNMYDSTASERLARYESWQSLHPGLRDAAHRSRVESLSQANAERIESKESQPHTVQDQLAVGGHSDLRKCSCPSRLARSQEPYVDNEDAYERMIASGRLRISPKTRERNRQYHQAKVAQASADEALLRLRSQHNQESDGSMQCTPISVRQKIESATEEQQASRTAEANLALQKLLGNRVMPQPLSGYGSLRGGAGHGAGYAGQDERGRAREYGFSYTPEPSSSSADIAGFAIALADRQIEAEAATQRHELGDGGDRRWWDSTRPTPISARRSNVPDPDFGVETDWTDYELFAEQAARVHERDMRGGDRSEDVGSRGYGS